MITVQMMDIQLAGMFWNKAASLAGIETMFSILAIAIIDSFAAPPAHRPAISIFGELKPYESATGTSSSP